MTEQSDSPLLVDFTVTALHHIPDHCRLRTLLNFAAEHESLSGEIGIWLCSDDAIADLHLRYMDTAGPTDVITFPGDESGQGAYLGDIAVSVDTAAEQARDAGHNPEREVAFLCLHGLLHLAGYDDMTDDGRDQMIDRQEALLSEFERKSGNRWRSTSTA
jgi:probable rRNA maturation factor